MGYRELLLLLVSIVLMSVLMTQINANSVAGREALQTLEIEHAAAAVAQQFIEEAKTKKFDHQVGIITPANMPNGFTAYNSLGTDGESYPNFNDVDDYNALTKTLYVDGIDFEVSAQVAYVQDTNPDSVVTAATFFKRMTVTVSSSWISNSITLKQVFSYFGVN